MKHHDTSEGPHVLSAGKRTRHCLRLVGLLMAALAWVLVSTGCASMRSADDSDPMKYNPGTGYPAVGYYGWGRF